MDDKQQIQQWLDKLRAGTLVEDDFQQALNRFDSRSHQLAAQSSEAGTSGNDTQSRQRLLYLQARTTGVDSEVLGMALVEDGQVREGPENPAEWPYKSVLEAINDGWRVIKFPEMALLLMEEQTFGLGCEFILEKLT
jgi:hypothetical protein